MPHHDKVAIDADLRDAIVAEHERLEGLLNELERGRQRDRLPSLLADLRDLLEQHFAREEAPDGFYDVLATKAPRHAETLGELRAEHGAMLASIGDLAQQAKTDKGDGLLREVARCCAQLRRHEARESRMMIDTLSRDGAAG